jgi:hypothetical protein
MGSPCIREGDVTDVVRGALRVFVRYQVPHRIRDGTREVGARTLGVAYSVWSDVAHEVSDAIELRLRRIVVTRWPSPRHAD